jgi:hypothetical protein
MNPSRTSSSCLLVSSGRLAGPAGPGTTDADRAEVALWTELTRRLRAQDVLVRLASAPVHVHMGPSGPAEVAACADAVSTALLADPPVDTVVALSLGAHATIAALGSLNGDDHGIPVHLVLAGFVIEQPVFLPHAVHWVDLVHGSGDLVAYLLAGQEPPTDGGLAGIPPQLYADDVARQLVGAGLSQVRTTVLDGLGHRLQQQRPGHGADAAGWLADTVVHLGKDIQE